MKSSKIFNNQFMVRKKISINKFGVVFLGFDQKSGEEVALKIEKQNNPENSILMRELQGLEGIPKLIWSGNEGQYKIIVQEVLGKNLAQILKSFYTFSLKTVLMVAEKLIILLEEIHSKEIIHSDIKPGNIFVSRKANQKQIYLLDFAIAKVHKQEMYVKMDSQFINEKPIKGSPMYSSISAHNDNELSSVDDLISLAYVLVFMFKGELPWCYEDQSEMSESEQRKIVRKKTELKSIELFKDMPMQFITFYDYLCNHNRSDIPNYKFLLLLIREAAESNQIVMDCQYDWVEGGENQDARNQEIKIMHKQEKPSVILSQFDESKFQKLDQWNDLDQLNTPIKFSASPNFPTQKIDFLKIPIPVQRQRKKGRKNSFNQNLLPVRPKSSVQNFQRQGASRASNSVNFFQQVQNNVSQFQSIKSDDDIDDDIDDDSVFIEDSISLKYDLLKQREVKAYQIFLNYNYQRQSKSNLDRTLKNF